MYVCQRLETGRKKVLVKIYGVSITVAACVCLYQRLCFVCLFVFTHLSFHKGWAGEKFVYKHFEAMEYVKN